MATTLRSEKVVEQWGTVIEGGAGRDKWVLDQVERLLKEASPPEVSIKREPVTSGLFGSSREFIILTHARLREYVMFIGAQNFGQDLAVSWYLTINPGFLKRALSKRLRHDPLQLSQEIPVFAQQDISTLMRQAYNRIRAVVQELTEELKQNTGSINWEPKGILSMW